MVIPDLFPRFEGDIQGIFLLDYLATTSFCCNNTVLYGRITSSKKGFRVADYYHYQLHSFALSEKKINYFLKPFYYVCWFYKGYKIGRCFKNINIIHAHGTILSGTLSWLLSKKLKVPFIITEHQGPFTMTSENFWKLGWTKFVMKRADAVLTVSHHLKSEILNSGIVPKKIIVTHNPVDTDLFKIKPDTKTKNILFVGRLDNFKGALRCVMAFNKIHQLLVNWQLTIVGSGEDEEPILTFLKNNTPLKKKVILRGSLTKEKIALEMAKADFFVFPSKHESFGLVVAEALSCGLPVIVGNTTGPVEFVNPSNGITVDTLNIEEISNAMLQLTKTYDTYDPKNIRNAIIDNFGFKSFGKKLTSIYQSFIK